MGKVFIYLFNKMTDYEISFICHILHTDVGKEVITIADQKKAVYTSSGFKVQPHYSISDVLDMEAEGLILCGGSPCEASEGLFQLIQQLHDQHKLLAAIGEAGTLMLAQAGVLDQVMYTTPVTQWNYEEGADPFPRINFINKRLVRDHHVITAQGTTFIDFTIEVCAWFKLFQNHQEKHNFARLLKRA